MFTSEALSSQHECPYDGELNCLMIAQHDLKATAVEIETCDVASVDDQRRFVVGAEKVVE